MTIQTVGGQGRSLLPFLCPSPGLGASDSLRPADQMCPLGPPVLNKRVMYTVGSNSTEPPHPGLAGTWVLSTAGAPLNVPTFLSSLVPHQSQGDPGWHLAQPCDPT